MYCFYGKEKNEVSLQTVSYVWIRKIIINQNEIVELGHMLHLSFN